MLMTEDNLTFEVPSAPVWPSTWVQNVCHDCQTIEELWAGLQETSKRLLLTNNFDSGRKDHNLEKNRYYDVLPLEETRVCLSGSNDYINANWIDGLCGERTKKMYISTQGPLENTTSDFWRMMWETGSSTIVMLTPMVENGKVKCSQYFPDSSKQRSENYGPFAVYIKSEHIFEHYALRSFDLKFGDQCREINHYHYFAWPDRGVPTSTTAFLQFISMLGKSPSPYVVHCSAGLGRTGVFILLHALMLKLEEVQANNVKIELDLNQALQKMRLQRWGLVQTAVQYQFCLQATYEILKQKCLTSSA